MVHIIALLLTDQVELQFRFTCICKPIELYVDFNARSSNENCRSVMMYVLPLSILVLVCGYAHGIVSDIQYGPLYLVNEH